MLDKFKQLNEVRKNPELRKRIQGFQEMQKEIEATVLEVGHKGVEVRLNGTMEILLLVSNGKDDDVVVQAINQANKAMQKELQKKFGGRMQSLGLGM